jgi:DNA-binding helix-hairpin-helix protein with protein kinase domain
MTLSPGTTLRSQLTRREVTIQKQLASGGQGTIYTASVDSRTVAVKWLHKAFATPACADRLDWLIAHGAPDPRLVWPLDIVKQKDGQGLGFLLPLIPDSYVGIPQLLGDRVRPTFRVLTKVCFELSAVFLSLQSKGLCYQDINDNNVLFHPQTGAVLICDNDNVAYNNTVHVSVGTSGFIAPELGLGETAATITTDLHSLGVLLFLLLMVADPFRGERDHALVCPDANDLADLYYRRPVFIFHPDDESNRPHPELHRNALIYWELYPQFLRDLFVQHFVAGLEDPEAHRVRPSQWRRAFADLSATISNCPHCTAEVFIDAKQSPQHCWGCQQVLPPQKHLKLACGTTVQLEPLRGLFPHHLLPDGPFDFSQPLAIVVQDPQQKRLGLKNLSADDWQVTHQGQAAVNVPPGTIAELRDATTLSFPSGPGVVVG